MKNERRQNEVAESERELMMPATEDEDDDVNGDYGELGVRTSYINK